jgi:hypothetical protein
MATNDSIKSLAEVVQKSISKKVVLAEPTDDSKELTVARQEIEAIQVTTGYMARAMALATIPHSKLPDDIIVYERQNGDYTLSLLANPKFGLPYGTIPRMLMSWVTMEAVRTQSPTIMLGETLSDFMLKLGYTPTWGDKGMVKQIKEQAKRLFTTGISCTYYNPKRGRTIHQVYIAKDYSEWWLPYNPEQRTLWESHIILSTDFFEEIIDRPVPISMETLANLRKSPMALDIYFWLTHRNFGHASVAYIGLDSLQHQFGASYPLTDRGRRNFKIKFLQGLGKVSETYSAAEKLHFEGDVLIVPPGRPDITHIPAHKGVTLPAVSQPKSLAATTKKESAAPEAKIYTASPELTDIQKTENCRNMKKSIQEHNAEPGAFQLPDVRCPQLGESIDSKCITCEYNPNKKHLVNNG